MKAAVVVGLLGSGKSSVGALVAGRTGCVLVNVDAAIEARTGETVRELWEDGEAAHRHVESDEVLRVRTALTGSTVMWLRTSPSTRAARVRPGDQRPLPGVRPYGARAAMAEARGGLYERVAPAIVGTDDLVPGAVADIVTGLLTGSPVDT